MDKSTSGTVPSSALSIGQCATLACLLEVSAPKPGNVHRAADFEDLSLYDFQWSAVAIAPAMEQASRDGVGAAVLEAVRATRAAVDTNTNLGTVLLSGTAGCGTARRSTPSGHRPRVVRAYGRRQPTGIRSHSIGAARWHGGSDRNGHWLGGTARSVGGHARRPANGIWWPASM